MSYKRWVIGILILSCVCFSFSFWLSYHRFNDNEGGIHLKPGQSIQLPLQGKIDSITDSNGSSYSTHEVDKDCKSIKDKCSVVDLMKNLAEQDQKLPATTTPPAYSPATANCSYGIQFYNNVDSKLDGTVVYTNTDYLLESLEKENKRLRSELDQCKKSHKPAGADLPTVTCTYYSPSEQKPKPTITKPVTAADGELVFGTVTNHITATDTRSLPIISIIQGLSLECKILNSSDDYIICFCFSDGPLCREKDGTITRFGIIDSNVGVREEKQ